MPGIKGKSGGKRKGAGRPLFVPTEKQRKLVETLVAIGTKTEDIPEFVLDENGRCISKQTLFKHFKTELKRGKAKAVATVAGALYKNAVEKHNVSAQIFFLKMRGGEEWREKPQQHQVTGKDGAPLSPPVITVVLGNDPEDKG